jgi:soluble lytic murein transglycosylase-like protein
MPLRASVTLFCLAILFASHSSDTSVPLPAVQERTALEGLAQWVVHGEGEPGAAITRADLQTAISADVREGFTLFSPAAEETASAGYLRGLPYGESLAAAADRHGVDGLLVAAIVEHESSFDPTSVSPRGAIGLMQLLPATGKAYGADDLFDPRVNLDVGTRYLSYLMELYEGELELALAAYNAGPAAVARYGGVPPYRETRQYVERVKAHYEELKKRVNRA